MRMCVCVDCGLHTLARVSLHANVNPDQDEVEEELSSRGLSCEGTVGDKAARAAVAMIQDQVTRIGCRICTYFSAGMQLLSSLDWHLLRRFEPPLQNETVCSGRGTSSV